MTTILLAIAVTLSAGAAIVAYAACALAGNYNKELDR